MEVLETVERIAESVRLSENEEMAEIYEEVFPAVSRFIHRAGGSLDDAKDVFHDALVIFIEKESQNPDVITSDKAYILGISKHLWIKKHRQDSRSILLNDMEREISIPEDYFPTVNDKRLLRFLKLAGKKCMDLLRAVYFRKLSMRKIASDLGYSGEHSASVQKYKCLEKIRNTVMEKSLTYEDFTE